LSSESITSRGVTVRLGSIFSKKKKKSEPMKSSFVQFGFQTFSKN